MKRRTPATNVDDYLAAVPIRARAALEKLRQTIRAAAPKATEVISYQVPIFKLDGGLVGFAAFENHCSFFVMSPAVMKAHQDDLKPYSTAAGTVHFAPDRPLPAALVKKLVKARIKENEARVKKPGKLRRSSTR
ncbi:MAG: DUF1801 domain-containing protein [Planctomycetia bacterium]|nr:DUF1801 domain-containing protein [Planctomycetia bacterium]